ncbi:chemotaxis-specific protein-glutamate methyltransferase CheB [Roseomonas frigidaquae]|uniref:Protein-glutamate methylesterase/protein-glutamine glutaminase n=1 Tax=Falsiroseomonas frigidaquae TaxID=487318 RepID=A0ABX1ETR0_9PROT|nr:chemotaxis-specific protein-glutamate methyltransferase CheB [Falsiroseomonas frigidaquae]NKE43299.1 chemotaxis-specific protein-glutamate methyltransferase CheB [Falsiroseomonas frigidaquae]
MTYAPLRVLVCDDSAVARAAVVRMLEADPALRVTSRARNGREAVDAIRGGGIDVAVLDLEMPVMDGMTALPLMLQADPALRVIVVSTLTTQGGRAAMEALRLGAADCLAKPAPGEDARFALELTARARGNGALRRRVPKPAPAPVAPPPRAAALPGLPPTILAIGASTGGPEALSTIFRAFRTRPRIPVLITQHMPDAFIPMLAEHLSRLGPMPVRVAKEQDALEPGTALLAPGGSHMLVGPALVGQGPRITLSDAPPEHFCRPAVDPMLRSVAALFGGRAAIAVLTGMGHDGGAGAGTVAAAGGLVLAQDQASSVVWGMPGAVVERGAAREVLALPDLARRLAELAGAA